MTRAQLLHRGHALYLFTQSPPVVRLQLCVLHTLLTPLLVQSANVILALLKVKKFIPNTFFNEDTSGVLLDDGLFVL
jgi:hypothetical protein